MKFRKIAFVVIFGFSVCTIRPMWLYRYTTSYVKPLLINVSRLPAHIVNVAGLAMTQVIKNSQRLCGMVVNGACKHPISSAAIGLGVLLAVPESREMIFSPLSYKIFKAGILLRSAGLLKLALARGCVLPKRYIYDNYNKKYFLQTDNHADKAFEIAVKKNDMSLVTDLVNAGFS